MFRSFPCGQCTRDDVCRRLAPQIFGNRSLWADDNDRPNISISLNQINFMFSHKSQTVWQYFRWHSSDFIIFNDATRKIGNRNKSNRCFCHVFNSFVNASTQSMNSHRMPSIRYGSKPQSHMFIHWRSLHTKQPNGIRFDECKLQFGNIRFRPHTRIRSEINGTCIFALLTFAARCAETKIMNS